MLPILDLVLLVVMLVVFFVIGVCFRQRASSTSSDYFLAGRTMAPIPAAFSISVSFLSSVSLTLYLGEVYVFGFPIYLMAVASVVVAPIVTIFIQHRFYDKPYLSIYQYFEERFSKSVRTVNSLIFIVAGIINVGVVGYAGSISAETLAGIPFWVSALTIGFFSTVYCAIGGLKAVIWTDVIQATMMILFFILIMAKALCSFDNLSEFWQLAYQGRRTELNFQEGPSHRYSFQSTFLRYVVFLLFNLSVSQPGVQRWKSVATLKQARITAVASLFFFGLFSLLMFFTGLALFTFYARCNVDRGSLPKAPEKISLYFVSTELSSWYGVTGLCLSGILSAALSTTSSFINSFAAVTLGDFIRIRYPCLTERQELNISKALTVAYGLVTTAIIFLVAAGSKMAVTIQGIAVALSTAPVLGTFILGIWTTRANSLGVSLGMILSVAVLLWLSAGSFMVGKRHEPLPLDNPECSRNTTPSEDQFLNFTVKTYVPQEDSSESGFLSSLYNISFVWYYFIGLATSLVLGYLLSLCAPACEACATRFKSFKKSDTPSEYSMENTNRSSRKDVNSGENEKLYLY